MSTWRNFEVTQWLEFVQLWTLPPSCMLCGKTGQSTLDLCSSCHDDLPFIELPCHVCSLPLPPRAESVVCGVCLQGIRRIERTVAALAYEDPVSMLITQFKYQRKLPAGRLLTQLLLDQIRSVYAPQSLPDLLMPIPLHDQRLRQRGYNQAQLIASDLGRALQIPVAADLLQRVRETPTQQGLRAHERKRNLRGAFVVSNVRSIDHCKRIALVDDVVTTMSTVREVAKTLQRGRTRPLEIHVWCLARA